MLLIHSVCNFYNPILRWWALITTLPDNSATFQVHQLKPMNPRICHRRSPYAAQPFRRNFGAVCRTHPLNPRKHLLRGLEDQSEILCLKLCRTHRQTNKNPAPSARKPTPDGSGTKARKVGATTEANVLPTPAGVY